MVVEGQSPAEKPSGSEGVSETPDITFQKVFFDAKSVAAQSAQLLQSASTSGKADPATLKLLQARAEADAQVLRSAGVILDQERCNRVQQLHTSLASQFVSFLTQHYDVSCFEFASHKRLGRAIIHIPGGREGAREGREITMIVPDRDEGMLEIWIPSSRRGDDRIRPHQDTYNFRSMSDLTEALPKIAASIDQGWKSFSGTKDTQALQQSEAM